MPAFFKVADSGGRILIAGNVKTKGYARWIAAEAVSHSPDRSVGVSRDGARDGAGNLSIVCRNEEKACLQLSRFQIESRQFALTAHLIASDSGKTKLTLDFHDVFVTSLQIAAGEGQPVTQIDFAYREAAFGPGKPAPGGSVLTVLKSYLDDIF